MTYNFESLVKQVRIRTIVIDLIVKYNDRKVKNVNSTCFLTLVFLIKIPEMTNFFRLF